MKALLLSLTILVATAINSRSVIAFLSGFPPSAAAPEADSALRDIADIRIRDPFILTDARNGRYLLVARIHRQGTMGWECFTSKDLRHWQAPVTVFTPPQGFWANRDFWAPEIHAYLGKYYLLGTVSSDHAKRGTQIFVADQPLGPYRPHSDGAVTPHDWMALDGTLYVENGHPWMVFCHEWVQIGDGTMNAIRLAKDLSRPIGEPIQLFRASEAPWCRPIKPGKYVTDGPWVYRMGNGKQLMLWSSFSDKGYAVGIARSQSGSMKGPWKHDPRPLFEGGGHCMVFRALDGKPMLVLHAPNKSPDERAKFFEIHEKSTDLHLEPVVWQRAK
jgi:arabinan endo-1,5-alpha-L-arabinosidase